MAAAGGDEREDCFGAPVFCLSHSSLILSFFPFQNLLYTDPFHNKRGVDTQECSPTQKKKSASGLRHFPSKVLSIFAAPKDGVNDNTKIFEHLSGRPHLINILSSLYPLLKMFEKFIDLI